MHHRDLICFGLSKVEAKVAGTALIFLDFLDFFVVFFTNTNVTFCFSDHRHSFQGRSPRAVTLHHPLLKHTPFPEVMLYLFLSLAGASAGTTELSRLEEWEGSEEERPGRLSAAGRMVSLSHGCGLDFKVYNMLQLAIKIESLIIVSLNFDS